MVLENIEAGYKEAIEASVTRTGGPGMSSFVAEMTISRYNGDSFEYYYVTYHDLDEILYAVSKISFLGEDFVGEEDFLEEYYSLEETKQSEFAMYFPVVERMVRDMQALKDSQHE